MSHVAVMAGMAGEVREPVVVVPAAAEECRRILI
jgi:hypothetical protein